MKTRWGVNITPAEPLARVVVGLVGAAGGLITAEDTMSIDRPRDQAVPAPMQPGQHAQHAQHAKLGHGGHGGHGGHRWMMIACCIPMLVVAVALVATGVAGAGTILVAIGCTVMMALTMRGMGHGDGDDTGR